MTPLARSRRDGSDIESIYRPWRLGSLRVPNRLVRSATEEGLSTGDGAPTQRLIDLIADLAVGGVGLIVAGSAYICHHIMPAPIPEGRFFAYALTIKRRVRCPVISVEGWRDPRSIAAALQRIDAVSLCRPFIREPHLAARWRDGDLTPATCISCNECLGLILDGGLGCIFNKRARARAATDA